MTKADVVLLLGFASMYDYRRIGEADVEAWYLVVGDLDLDDAKAAVIAHYRDSTERLMPAHVRQGVKTIRADRRREQTHEVRALPSRFEADMGRQVRMERGAAQVREVLGPVLQHLADRSGAAAAVSAVEELRAITAGPGWTADGDDTEEAQ